MSFKAVLPDGKEINAEVLSTSNKTLVIKCTDAASIHTAASPCMILFQGSPKGTRMDIIVRQAAEAEVNFIVPFLSDYSESTVHSSEKIKRWERIIKEARQQSGSSIDTRLIDPGKHEDLLSFWESKRKEYIRPVGIILHQEALEKASFHGYLGKNPDLIALMVGPEGGFSSREISLFLDAGFKPLKFGNSILRCETAALYGIAAIRTILTESEDWTPLQTEFTS